MRISIIGSSSDVYGEADFAAAEATDRPIAEDIASARHCTTRFYYPGARHCTTTGRIDKYSHHRIISC
ncbi:hypothetical protein M8J77_015742 [Diaphorina citri]|nr:hypothetical protein M8J77_015742 [Diaphorina citri]